MKSILSLMTGGVFAIASAALYDLSRNFPQWSTTCEVGVYVLGVLAFVFFVAAWAYADS